jgi:ribonuclease HII
VPELDFALDTTGELESQRSGYVVAMPGFFHSLRRVAYPTDAETSRGVAKRPQRIVTPTLRVERRFWREGMLRVVGIDECGVAALSGPVVACALYMPPNCRKIHGVRDSKTLSRPERERLSDLIRGKAIRVGIGAASAREIERLNILRATHLAMRRALDRVGPCEHTLIDGSPIRDTDMGPHTCIVRGDASSYSIAAASVVGKVCRDRLMAKLALRYPGYGWEHNAGYPTPDHRDAIHRLGLTPHHRRSFGTVRRLMQLSLDLEGTETLAASDLDSLDSIVLETEAELTAVGV